MQSEAKSAALKSILELMDGLMLEKAKGRRKQPAVVEMTVASAPDAKDAPAKSDELADEDARSLADLYADKADC